MTQGRARGNWPRVLAIGAAALVAVSCGSRLDQTRIAADAGVGRSDPQDDSRQATATQGGSATADTLEIGEPGGATDGSTQEATDTGVAPSDGSASATTLPGSTATTAAGRKDPILIGSVSNISGPGGAAQADGVQAVQVWVRWINSKGGLNGHEVRFFQQDDAGDPARHAAAVKDLVENKRVVAIVGQFAALTGNASGKYLAEKRIPVVGGDRTLLDLWYGNPMYFPQAAPIDVTFPGALRAMRSQTAGRRLGILYCYEAQACKDGAAVYARAAPANGFEVVYQGQASVAQPDFTAECLAAKSARVDVLAGLFDTNSIKRVSRSCSSQAFNPKYVLVNGGSDNSFAKLPDFNGAAGAYPVYPFFRSETAAAKEFHDAHRRFAPGRELSPIGADGWAAAKLFEKVASGGAGAPTSESILKALHSLRDETLGGFTGPLTFTAGKPAPRVQCYFPIAIQRSSWTALKGNDFECL